ncbi:hypothetical protein CLV84_4157 [Neolewinella xylanilytica]|uniref:Uncharacterized protein n=1 Tax=Neolewinella xylanilytica TaxID=1514080 RepID=A0A2S6I0T8_9BACT|nr:hypothetical protein [Neolewinella xylanilytica]PPK84387.1 hypothetical protein CLV84_4157 [Neolewinella xylanilytica]
MPLFNDLKRIFFGAKSVAKHQASRAGDVAREAGDELADQGEELFDLTRRATRDLAARAPGYIEKGKGALSELGDKVYKQDPPKPAKPTPPTDEDDGDAFDFDSLDLTSEADAPKSGSIDFEADLVEDTPPSAKEPSALNQLADSTLDAAARTGVKAKQMAKEAGDELLDRAARTGADLKGKADKFIDHANREAEKMRLEDSIEEAKRAAAQAEARARAFDNKENERDASGSTLSGTDSFFDRADRFARGDYHNEGGKDMRVQNDPDYKPRKKSDLIAGFDDNDNDGDSLIDDAILEEE